jgi:2-polyprenyl-3-methyl-5-hydroxy-6-metoxy-1,4-benzoquinol methylase
VIEQNQATEESEVYDQLIGTHASPLCYLCEQKGETLYEGLIDRLFGAPGNWNLKRCSAPQCGLIWLDPMPREEEIGKAYRTYHTHADSSLSPKATLYRKAKSIYARTYYRANGMKPSVWAYLTALPIRAMRSVRDEIDIPMKYLATRRGRMLDVGCGNGDLICLGQSFGWEAEGIDVDEKAIFNARGKGLNVRFGTLAEQAYPDSIFDLITIDNVIEHVHDPIRLLRESCRVLKPDGLLLVLTPNTASTAHTKFGAHWYALQPPTHLMLFGPRNLREVARRAGFNRIELATSLRMNLGSEGGSQRIRDGRYPGVGNNVVFSAGELLHARLIGLALQMRLWVSPLLGDELLLEARK